MGVFDPAQLLLQLKSKVVQSAVEMSAGASDWPISGGKGDGKGEKGGHLTDDLFVIKIE